MKHLKKFNESGQMIDTNNLNDILQDIIELGYTCHVESHWWSDSENSIDVTIYGKKDRSVLGFIDIQEVLPELERLINYLSTEDYSMDDSSKKRIQTFKDVPSEKFKQNFEVPISNTSRIDLVWNKDLNKYEMQGSLSLYFRENL
jgi:hypothetical protein